MYQICFSYIFQTITSYLLQTVSQFYSMDFDSPNSRSKHEKVTSQETATDSPAKKTTSEHGPLAKINHQNAIQKNDFHQLDPQKCSIEDLKKHLEQMSTQSSPLKKQTHESMSNEDLKKEVQKKEQPDKRYDKSTVEHKIQEKPNNSTLDILSIINSRNQFQDLIRTHTVQMNKQFFRLLKTLENFTKKKKNLSQLCKFCFKATEQNTKIQIVINQENEVRGSNDTITDQKEFIGVVKQIFEVILELAQDKQTSLMCLHHYGVTYRNKLLKINLIQGLIQHFGKEKREDKTYLQQFFINFQEHLIKGQNMSPSLKVQWEDFLFYLQRGTLKELQGHPLFLNEIERIHLIKETHSLYQFNMNTCSNQEAKNIFTDIIEEKASSFRVDNTFLLNNNKRRIAPNTKKSQRQFFFNWHKEIFEGLVDTMNEYTMNKKGQNFKGPKQLNYHTFSSQLNFVRNLFEHILLYKKKCEKIKVGTSLSKALKLVETQFPVFSVFVFHLKNVMAKYFDDQLKNVELPQFLEQVKDLSNTFEIQKFRIKKFFDTMNKQKLETLRDYGTHLKAKFEITNYKWVSEAFLDEEVKKQCCEILEQGVKKMKHLKQEFPYLQGPYLQGYLMFNEFCEQLQHVDILKKHKDQLLRSYLKNGAPFLVYTCLVLIKEENNVPQPQKKKICFHGPYCQNKPKNKCPYGHPPPCPKEDECTETPCQLWHPKNCRGWERCTKQDCFFRHPPKCKRGKIAETRNTFCRFRHIEAKKNFY